MIDTREYLPYLEDSDMSEEQKLEYLETVGKVVMAFIDHAFDGKVDDNDETTKALHSMIEEHLNSADEGQA